MPSRVSLGRTYASLMTVMKKTLLYMCVLLTDSITPLATCATKN